MNQPHPEEESWQVKRFREADEKKLFTLHSQNQRLLTQQEEFEVVITDYAHKIDSFNEKSLRLEEQNAELKEKLDNLSRKYQKTEELLSKRNEEYCTLYNYLFTEQRGAIQDAFLKEIDLTNRLNEIQHESDTQIIQKLKEAIKAKNEELLKHVRRITDLNQALASSSFEYQEKINTLKNENLRLLSSAPAKQNQNDAHENIGQYCLNKKIEGLQKQISLYKSQLTSNKAEQSKLRKSNSVLEGAKIEIENELKAIKSFMPTFDQSLYNILRENTKLKQDLQAERLKYQEFYRNYPELLKRSEEVNSFLRAKENESRLTKEINRLEDQGLTQKKQVEILKLENKSNLQAKLQAVKKYESLKIVSTSAFQKLKDVIATYVPYIFRRGGLENYNLDKEEQQFIQQKNVEKTLQEVYQQINNKITEAHQAKQKQADIQKKSILHLQKIAQLQREVARKQKEIGILSESVESLMQAKKNHEGSQIVNHYGYEGFEEEELNQIVNEDDYLQKVRQSNGQPLENGYQIKISILEKAVEELQTDRSQLISIIKSKQMTISQLTAELNVLKSLPNITTINIQRFPNNQPAQAVLQSRNEGKQIEKQQIFSNYTDFNEIRQELRNISNQYKFEKELLIKEYEKKEALSISKYLNLLKLYDDLSAKYNSLEASIANNKEASINSDNQNQQSASEMPAELPPNHQVQQQKDQAAISQSAIQNFTDTLKKYEKEFNKFVAIYEAQIKKSMESSMISENVHQSEGESQGQSEEHLERLQTLLSQHHDTIKHLENILTEKQQQSELIASQLQEQLKQSHQKLAELTTRLEEAETTIATLKSQTLSEKIGQDFTSSESANTAFLILNAKNKQIDSLKFALEKQRRLFEDKSREVAKLKQFSSSHTPFEAEQYRLFRQIVQEEDLLGVLEAVAGRLE